MGFWWASVFAEETTFDLPHLEIGQLASLSEESASFLDDDRIDVEGGDGATGSVGV